MQFLLFPGIFGAAELQQLRWNRRQQMQQVDVKAAPAAYHPGHIVHGPRGAGDSSTITIEATRYVLPMPLAIR